jgi:choline kinase
MEETGESSDAPHRKQQYVSQKLLSQVSDWLEHERRRKHARESRTGHHTFSRRKRHDKHDGESEEAPGPRARTDSIDSNSSEMALDKLQRIIEDNMSALGLDSVPHLGPKLGRPSLHRHKKSGSRSFLQRNASSDTDYVDGDAMVPSCDVVLDNTKTMSYSSGKSTENLAATGKAESKERDAWSIFRNEIIRLTHTLRIKGWRQVPLEGGDRISVQRLSGALTNAVYVVTPPDDLEKVHGKKLPSKLLLRIYGPNVEQLIDRDVELGVLKRLARKKIGPRLLGTFRNGRFEEYFNSTTLTAENLREPETFKSIAKRMRELHDGVEVLDHEREAGPSVWCNWDKWVDTVEKNVLMLDEETRNKANGRARDAIFCGEGFVCGAEWPVFKAMVEKYRAHLESIYRSKKELNGRMVFAHNDVRSHSSGTSERGLLLGFKLTCATCPDPIRQHPSCASRRLKVSAAAAGK